MLFRSQAKTIRGYSPELVVIDEAAYLPEEMWETALPMLNAPLAVGRRGAAGGFG